MNEVRYIIGDVLENESGGNTDKNAVDSLYRQLDDIYYEKINRLADVRQLNEGEPPPLLERKLMDVEVEYFLKEFNLAMDLMIKIDIRDSIR